MVVSFSNASLLSLTESISVIMGANIGTTVTAWIISFDLKAVAPIFVFVGVIMMFFFKKRIIKRIGGIILGFGVLFVGLVFPHPPFEVEEPFYSLHDRAQVPEPAPVPRDPTPRFMGAIREAYGTERLTPDDWAEIIGCVEVPDDVGRLVILLGVSGQESADDVAWYDAVALYKLDE